MAKIIKTLDLFGIKYIPKFDSKKNFKTSCGVFFTTIFISISIFVIYLFSRDFINKTNPKVLSSDIFSKDPKIYEVDNSNFFLAWSTFADDGSVLAENEIFQFPYISYIEMGSSHDDPYFNEYIVAPKPCVEVLTAEQITKSYFFNQSLCFDLSGLKKKLGKEVTFFGNFDSNHNTFFYLEFSNCKYNMEKSEFEHCLSLEEILKRSNKNMFFSLIFPKIDVEINNFDNPITKGYSDVTYSVSAFSKIYERIVFTNLVLEDDLGWINENIERNENITYKSNRTNFGVNLPEKFVNDNRVVFYQFDVLFSLSEMNYKRIYVKIQEVAANLGGILRVIMFFFEFFSKLFTSVDFDNYLVSRFSKKIKLYQNGNISSIEDIRNITYNIKEDEIKLKGILYGRLYKRDEFNEYNNILKKIEHKIDLLSLIDNMLDFEKIVSDIKDLPNNSSNIQNSNAVIRLRNNERAN